MIPAVVEGPGLLVEMWCERLKLSVAALEAVRPGGEEETQQLLLLASNKCGSDNFITIHWSGEYHRYVSSRKPWVVLQRVDTHSMRHTQYCRCPGHIEACCTSVMQSNGLAPAVFCYG